MIDKVSSLELHYLVEEFQELISAKVDKIFQPKKNFKTARTNTKMARLPRNDLCLTAGSHSLRIPAP